MKEVCLMLLIVQLLINLKVIDWETKSLDITGTHERVVNAVEGQPE